MSGVQREDTGIPALIDKIGVPVGKGDYVLVAHNGPYLNFGRVWRVQTSPRVTLEIQEVYQPENDPSKPFLVRLQSICSSHRVVQIQAGQVPVAFRQMLPVVSDEPCIQ
ncbi:hypothetical protein EKK58_00820 [Candidatus Dependentiae bacterium]|nr:MAG: hypothetical protein EKK58_00820 [Candidatus Dependentiae bacterium]